MRVSSTARVEVAYVRAAATLDREKGPQMKGFQFLSGLLCAALLVGGTAVPAMAQVTTGTISGTVKDEQGLPVPGATIVLVSESRGTKSAQP